MIAIKRAYEEAAKEDGERILVERLWPRGVSKEKAVIDLWMKEIAPTTELRKWFGHIPERWEEFEKRYWKELEGNKEAVDALRKLMKEKKKVTFIYAAHDEEHNGALALKTFLEHRKH